MKSKCPACARSTAVPPDLLDFLVRCDYCGAMLRAKVVPNGKSPEAPDKLLLQALPVGRLADSLPIVRVSVVDVLTRATPVVPAKAEPAMLKLPAQRKTLQHGPTADTHDMLSTENAVAAAVLQEPAVEQVVQVEPEMEESNALDDLVAQTAARAARAKALKRAKLKSSHFVLGMMSAVTMVLLVTIAGGVAFAYSQGVFKPKQAQAAPHTPTEEKEKPVTDGSLFEETKIKR